MHDVSFFKVLFISGLHLIFLYNCVCTLCTILILITMIIIIMKFCTRDDLEAVWSRLNLRQ